MIAYNVGFHHLYQLNDVSRIEDFIRAAANPIGNNIQQIDVVGFGGVNGEYVGLRRDAPEQYSLMLKDARTDDKLVIYQTATKNDQLRTVIDNYDPRVRPWFAPSRRSHRHNGLRFIPIWMRSKRSLSALSPVFQDKRFIGVMVSDVKLNTFNQFLSELKQRMNADVYVMDKQHRLIAHSGEGSVVSWGHR